MSSVLGLNHLVAPSAVGAAAATVVTATAESNEQAGTPPPTTTTTTASALLHGDNGRSPFEGEESKNQGEIERFSSPTGNSLRIRTGNQIIPSAF